MTAFREVLYEIELTAAGMWSKVLGRGKTLRIEDLEGGANVGMLIYNADERQERYNMPDPKGNKFSFSRVLIACTPTWPSLCSITATVAVGMIPYADFWMLNR